MSLKLIIGGSGTGKTDYLLDLVIEQSIKYPDRNYLVLVPGQQNMQTGKQIIKKHPCHGYMNIDIMSFERLAYKVFDELGTADEQILDDTGKSMIIRRLLKENKESLHAFAGSIAKQGFVLQMRSMISELLQYSVSPDELLEKSAKLQSSSGLFAKLRDIHVIYSSFMEYLKDRYITPEEIIGRLADVIDRSAYIRNVSIFMDGYTGFTPVQYKLIEKLLDLAPSVTMTIAVSADQEPYKTPVRDELFYITKETISRLEAICMSHGIARDRDVILKDAGRRFKSRYDLIAIEENLYRTQISPYRGSYENVKLNCLNDPSSEILFVSKEIHSLIKSGKYRYKDIAVVTSDMDRYSRNLKYWFGKYQIPCFIDDRRPVDGNMLSEWARALIDIFIKGFSYESLIRFLKNPLCGYDLDFICMLENYLLASGIKGSGRWQSRWNRTTSDFTDISMFDQFRQEFMDLLEDDDGKLISPGKKYAVRDIVSFISSLMEKFSIRSRMEDIAVDFSHKGDLEKAKEYEQVYDATVSLLDNISFVLGEEAMTLKEFRGILETGLKEVNIGIIPPAMDQVLFGNLRRTRPGSIKVLFFLGMNDGLVPLPTRSNSLITENERTELAMQDLVLAPAARENFSTEKYYLYAALTKPSEKLYITFSDHEPDGRKMYMSSVAADIQKILPDLKVNDHKSSLAKDDIYDVNHAYNCLIDDMAKYANEEKIPSDGFRLFRWFLADDAEKERTLMLKNAALYRYRPKVLSETVMNRLYKGRLTGGVTMLEKYAQCAYSHFLQYGIRLKERDIYKIVAPDLGILMHKGLELFCGSLADQGCSWRDISDDRRDELAAVCLREAAEGYNNHVFKDTARSMYLLDRLENVMKKIVWALQQQIKKGDFDPVGAEIRFDQELDDGIILHGKIDRCDIDHEGDAVFMRIIDYKTGNKSLDPTLVYHGIQLQLLVYMNAAIIKQQKLHSNSQVIPAGVFYFHIDDPILETDGIDGLDNADDMQFLEQLKLTGLCIGSEDDDSVIRRMDNRPDESPKVLPVSYSSKGVIIKSRSSMISDEDFQRLSLFVREREKALSKGILSGRIPVSPYTYGQHVSCAYCSFRSVCRFDPYIKGFRMRYLNKPAGNAGWERITSDIDHQGEN